MMSCQSVEKHVASIVQKTPTMSPTLTFLVLVSLAHALALESPPQSNGVWEDFKVRFSKKYETAEEDRMRQNIFWKNVITIVEHHIKYMNNEISYDIGLNKFSDMVPQEIEVITKCMKRSATPQNIDIAVFQPPVDAEAPESVDWRVKGVVTPVKDQGLCGSCWAFSTTGVVEGQHALKMKSLVSLSEQNLVDCDKKDLGCGGGDPLQALEYIKTHGIDTEDSYPYKDEEDSCHFKPQTVGARIKGTGQVKSGDEESLKIAVSEIGPISVSIDATDDFQAYSRGIFNSTKCSSLLKDADHAVLVVGYGTTKKGEDYWLVKNSWGEQWGEKGYIRMARNNNNMCGIANEAVYPIV